MPFSDNIFHAFSIDFEAFFVPSKHEKTCFFLGKTTLFAKLSFGEKHDFLIDFIIIFGSIFLQFWHRFSILFRYRFQGHIFRDIFRFLVPLSTPKGSHWRPSGRHFRVHGAPNIESPEVRVGPWSRSGRDLSPLRVARATLHVQRRTCNVQRRIFDVFSSFFIDFSSHSGSIFVYFWHVFASILPILFSHCNVQRRISNCCFLIRSRF